MELESLLKLSKDLAMLPNSQNWKQNHSQIKLKLNEKCKRIIKNKNKKNHKYIIKKNIHKYYN